MYFKERIKKKITHTHTLLFWKQKENEKLYKELFKEMKKISIIYVKKMNKKKRSILMA